MTPTGGQSQPPHVVACTTTCTATFDAPVGSDSIALKLTDGPNGTGNQLSLATTTVAVAANIVNTLNLTANPVVSSVAVQLGASPAASLSTSGGTAADIPVTVKAMDADGNTIVGPGSYVDASGNAVALTLAVTNAQAGGSGTVSFTGPTTITAPGISAVAHYDGKWLDHATIDVHASTGTISSSSSAALVSAPTVSGEYPLPTANAQPQRIVAGADGNLWFSEYQAWNAGKISTAGVVTEIPLGHGRPKAIALGADGNIWIGNDYFQGIEQVTSSGTVTYFSTYADGINALVLASDGNLWYSDYNGYSIGRITPSGSVVEYSMGSHPVGVAQGSDGNIWFTDYTGNRIGRMDFSGSYVTFSVPTANSYPGEITKGSDGNCWFSETNGSKIAKITPAGSITEYATSSSPGSVISGPDGNIWFIESGTNQIARITPNGILTEYPIPTANSGASGITFEPDGNIWFTEETANQIGTFVL